MPMITPSGWRRRGSRTETPDCRSSESHHRLPSSAVTRLTLMRLKVSQLRSAARARHPDAVALGAAVQFEVEGVEGSRERGGHRHSQFPKTRAISRNTAPVQSFCPPLPNEVRAV